MVGEVKIQAARDSLLCPDCTVLLITHTPLSNLVIYPCSVGERPLECSAMDSFPRTWANLTLLHIEAAKCLLGGAESIKSLGFHIAESTLLHRNKRRSPCIVILTKPFCTVSSNIANNKGAVECFVEGVAGAKTFRGILDLLSFEVMFL